MSNNVKTEYVKGYKPEEDKPEGKWWKLQDPHGAIFSTINRLEEKQGVQHTDFIKFARLYSNKELLGLSAGLYYTQSAEQLNNTNRLTLNVVKSCVDTAAAKIAKMRPKPLFLTSGGDWTIQQKGKNLTKFVEGIFDSAKIYEHFSRMFVDACIFGSGFVKVFHDGSNIKAERVLPTEMIVDAAESIYGQPRSIHQRRYVNRDVLIEMFPEQEAKLKHAASGLKNPNINDSHDMVMVVESWHLPSGDKAKDGKHTICVDNCTLFQEDYTKTYFPFIKFSWSEKIVGYFGMGLSEELIGLQIEINKILQTIQKAQHLAAVPRVYIESGSKVVSAHINNEIGSIIKYTGTAPVIQPSQAVPTELYSHLQNLYSKAYEITGISMMSATSQKPSGLNSGVAMREYQDIETERFMIVAQRYEQSFLELSRIIVDLAKDLYESDKKLSVQVKGSKFIETIKWKDIDLDQDQFTMKVFPVSILPSTPAGRLQKVQELVQAGFIGKEDALALLDFPDLDSVMNLNLAARNDIMKQIDVMINEGRYMAPEPFMNLMLALNLAQSSYLNAKVNNVSEERLQLLRDYMQDILDLQAQANPPAPEAVPQTGMEETIAQPQGQPVSDLLPVI